MLEVSLLGAGTLLCLDGMRGQWSNDKSKQQMSAPPPPVLHARGNPQHSLAECLGQVSSYPQSPLPYTAYSWKLAPILVETRPIPSPQSPLPYTHGNSQHPYRTLGRLGEVLPFLRCSLPYTALLETRSILAGRSDILRPGEILFSGFPKRGRRYGIVRPVRDWRLVHGGDRGGRGGGRRR